MDENLSDKYFIKSESITNNKSESFNDNINSNSNSETITTSSDENLSQNNNLDLNGKTLRHYNIIYELGRGSYSIVWLSYNTINKLFYAIKVQNPSDFKEGLHEIKFVQKLPKNSNLFNNLIEYFIETDNDSKYLCSVWNLHCFNIDTLIRKCGFNNGLLLNNVKYIMKQLIHALYILHKKMHVFHGDIKTDNILIKGINNRDKFICKKYKELILESNNQDQEISDPITEKNNLINQKSKNSETCTKTMNFLNHEKIVNLVYEESEKYSNLDINNKYLDKINISLADFGTFCEENKTYTGTFGTRYYQAPEIILLGNCSYPVDIWALGCTFYELLSGEILFNPIKDSKWSRDYYHLCLINDTCGSFPNNFLKTTKNYNNFFKNNKIIDYENLNHNRLDTKINSLKIANKDKKIIKELLQFMLIIDQKKRCTIDHLYNHIFFD